MDISALSSAAEAVLLWLAFTVGGVLLLAGLVAFGGILAITGRSWWVKVRRK